ncbi:MAG: toll/interleukin-1 receptor domain-containing protein [Victivallales bacterium]|jgi:hypothetical protein
MGRFGKDYELPKNIEHYLAALAKLYGKKGNSELQRIIVNSQVRVHEGWSSDNWNGGTYGHALYLSLPEILFLDLTDRKADIQAQINADINKIHNIHNEFIEEVFLKMEILEDQNWRKDSGLLVSNKTVVPPAAELRIWEKDCYRVFFSHKVQAKKQTAELKSKLRIYGASCFVAHENIHATQKWQDEIENALLTMDVLVALMTEDFHASDWTDQEVGYALGRGINVIPIKLGKVPYGFIGKFQALSCDWEGAETEIVKILIKDSKMKDAYIKAINDCSCFDTANKLAKILPYITSLSNQQVTNIVDAYNGNGQIRDSFGFNGENPRTYGPGLFSILKKITGNEDVFKDFPSKK